MNNKGVLVDLFRVYWQNTGREFVMFLKQLEPYKTVPEFVDALERIINLKELKQLEKDIKEIKRKIDNSTPLDMIGSESRKNKLELGN